MFWVHLHSIEAAASEAAGDAAPAAVSGGGSVSMSTFAAMFGGR